MKTLQTLALKVLGFFAFMLAFWKWGEASAQKKEALSEAKEIIKQNEEFKEIWSAPPVDDPFLRMCNKKK